MLRKQDALNIIANNIKLLMNKNGVSNPELSKRCGISSGMISKIVNARTGITIETAMNLATGLNTNLAEVLQGLEECYQNQSPQPNTLPHEQIAIGILSIGRKRIICARNKHGEVIGESVLAGDLDLAESSSHLLNLIKEAIATALPNIELTEALFKQMRVNLVTQSYEFEKKRSKFIMFSERHFRKVTILPDWQITYLSAFSRHPGLSLIIDKGVSLSYFQHSLKKIGGWKFPVYDLGGENWLGVETIRHTIEALEGHVPMSKLANEVASRYHGKISNITEACFKGIHDPDVYCDFSEPLLRCYFTGDQAARTIIESGLNQITKLVYLADKIIGHKLDIIVNGSLKDIYAPLLNQERLQPSPSTQEQVQLLSTITEALLTQYGVAQNH